MKKTESGITLIALVVTIVVLLILAGVSLNLVLGENGIINKAKDAEVVTRAGSVEDEIELWKADQYLGEETNDTAETEEEMLARLTANKLITADDEVDTENKVIRIRKKDKTTVVKEISYAYTTNKVTENIFEYTEEGYITGIKEEYLTTTNPETANIKELVKMANINKNNFIKIADAEAEWYLIKELNEEITIPEEIEGTKIIGIDSEAFAHIRNLRKVTINAEINEIRNHAFSACFSLSTINIPDSVTTIGNDVFFFCQSLSTINIPDSVTTIGQSAFGVCTRLTEITIPNSVTTIGDLAFSGCENLSIINIPNSVTTIGEYTFAACTSLTEITIPNKDINVGECIFNNGADITVNVPFKEGEQPATWDANWNRTDGNNTVTVNYAK